MPVSPLTPRHLRRPFSAATGSGRYFFAQGWDPPGGSHRAKPPEGSLRSQEREGRLSRMLSRSAPVDAETNDVGVAVAQPLSPELVLVSPDLRAQALELLPALDPDALFEVLPRPTQAPALDAPPHPSRSRLLAVAAYAVEALVFGALRAIALIVIIATAAFLLAR